MTSAGSLLLVAGHLFLAAPATKETPSPDTAQELPPEPSPPKLPWLGASVFVGAPDGAGVAVVVRPWRWLRVEAGALHNLVSPGVYGGVSGLLLPGWLTPSLTLEGGYYFPGNANGVVQLVRPSFQSHFLDSVQYNFINAHLGLELGSPRRFTFFVHGGFTHVNASDNSFTAGLAQNTNMNWSGTAATASLNAVSGKLGFILYVG
jgi:hypothetical protein